MLQTSEICVGQFARFRVADRAATTQAELQRTQN